MEGEDEWNGKDNEMGSGGKGEEWVKGKDGKRETERVTKGKEKGEGKG